MATVGSLTRLRQLPPGTRIGVRGKRLRLTYRQTTHGWVEDTVTSPLAPAPAPFPGPSVVYTDQEMFEVIARVSTTARPAATVY